MALAFLVGILTKQRKGDGKMQKIAIACQGGGSHTAFTAGVLKTLLEKNVHRNYQLVGLSGTSGGAVCALLTWYSLLRSAKGDQETVYDRLIAFWEDNTAQLFWEQVWNGWSVGLTRLQSSGVIPEFKLSPYTPSTSSRDGASSTIGSAQRVSGLRRATGTNTFSLRNWRHSSSRQAQDCCSAPSTCCQAGSRRSIRSRVKSHLMQRLLRRPSRHYSKRLRSARLLIGMGCFLKTHPSILSWIIQTRSKSRMKSGSSRSTQPSGRTFHNRHRTSSTDATNWPAISHCSTQSKTYTESMNGSSEVSPKSTEGRRVTSR